MRTQREILNHVERQSFEVNELFLEFVRDGLTREELARNIERRPALWRRFEGWLDKLPSSSPVAVGA
jgi:hypothetical protein